jgi:hypothetical protein
MVPCGAEDVHGKCFRVTLTVLEVVRLLLPLVAPDGVCLLLLLVAAPAALLPLISSLVKEYILVCESVKRQTETTINSINFSEKLRVPERSIM